MRPDPYKQKASRRYQAAHKSAQKKNEVPERQPPPTADTTETNTSQHRGSKYSRRKIQDNSWRYRQGEEEEEGDDDGTPMDSLEAAEAKEDEYVQEFLAHLEEKSQRASSGQSAAYFQLRAETVFADIDTYNEEIWNSLLDVDWDGLVDVAASTPLRKLIGASEKAAIPEGVSNVLANTAKSNLQSCSQQKPTRQISAPGNSFKLNAADLAPGISSSKLINKQNAQPLPGTKPETQKQQPSATKPSVSIQRPSTITTTAAATIPSSVVPKPQQSAKPAQSVDELEAFLDEIL